MKSRAKLDQSLHKLGPKQIISRGVFWYGNQVIWIPEKINKSFHYRSLRFYKNNNNKIICFNHRVVAVIPIQVYLCTHASLIYSNASVYVYLAP